MRIDTDETMSPLASFTVTLLATVLLLGVGPGCESAVRLVPCETLMDDVYGAEREVTDEAGQPLDRDGAAELCVLLEADSAEAGCEDEYDRWFGCVEALVDATGSCRRERLSARACVDGDAYEYDCADGADGDDDGDTDCADADCLEVCADGPCPGNTDPAEAYAAGQPAARDPDLPVEACWHVVHDPQCADAREAGLRIARRSEPPERTFAFARCTWAPTQETSCDDQVDDDGDCLVDGEDPDCNG